MYPFIHVCMCACVCVVFLQLLCTSLLFLDVRVGGCAVLKRDERYIFYLVSKQVHCMQ